MTVCQAVQSKRWLIAMVASAMWAFIIQEPAWGHIHKPSVYVPQASDWDNC